uniref:Nuclear factor of kappa light polypeptide gene enhancer in B-cells 2 (p49/p100) n=1 Tax=Oreochromis niloticus TaxID=8128 RepID=A0A669C6H1_ORENI
MPETAHGPYIQIIEEPKQRGFRFRYECEGPSHGGLPGASSEKNKRTYPTVRINNYVGLARVEVQLVTHTDPPRVHAHSLVGRHCIENGTCTIDIGPNDLTASFSNLGILHVTKKGVVEVLTRRLREEKKRLKGAHCHLTDVEESAIVKEAKELGKTMDLNIVRLKFTAYLQDSTGAFTRALKPVVSNPIYDSKSPNASNLKISRMDKTCGSVLGGDEIFLLCDKVQKDDIEIRFYEEDEDGCWEAFGDFSPTDVHKQYAIVFKTPAYHSTEIERPVTVFLQLRRKKAGDSSDPKQFTYIPQVQGEHTAHSNQALPVNPHRGSQMFGVKGHRGGAGTGGFFNVSFPGFGNGGGAQMSGSAPRSGAAQQQQQSDRQSGGQSDSPLRQQLLQIAAALNSRVSQSARQTAAALLQYCSTGDARVLLAIQRHLCGIQDGNGDTPLHLAIIHHQTGVIQQLIHTLLSSQQQGIINTANHLQQTPLHLAVITRQVKVVEVLLKAGADPSLVDKDGQCHAHLVNMPDFHGLHPLHLAVRRDGERCLRLLVEGGAKINEPEQKSGNTALHLAVRENLFKVACLLITELRADVNACTFGGNTPLHLAASLGSPTFCSMLIAAGADKSIENDEPLFFSSSSSDDEDEPIREEEKEREVAPKTSNPRKRPAGGHTPLDLAKCQKVRKVLSPSKSPKSDRRGSGNIRPTTSSTEGSSDTLSRLVDVLSVGDVPWKKLAEKLGMMTLTHLYQDCPMPCRQLLQHYKLGGGAVEGLVEALHSLGLTEGVRLLRNAELRDDKHNTDVTVDSGFGSQPMEDVEPPAGVQ